MSVVMCSLHKRHTARYLLATKKASKPFLLIFASDLKDKPSMLDLVMIETFL